MESSTWLCFHITHAPKQQSLRLVEITVWCRYNAVSSLQNIHNRHTIARPLGRYMGFLVWGQAIINVLPRSSSDRCIFASRYNRTPLYSPLAALGVLKMITSNAAGDGSFVAVMTFPFRCIATDLSCIPVYKCILDWFTTWCMYRVQLSWFHRFEF